MIRPLEGSPARPGLGHQSTLGQSELRCGSSGYEDTWCPSGPWLDSDLGAGSQYHQCLHYPGTADTLQPREAEKSYARRNQGAHCTRMWSNNGTQPQWGYLSLAPGGLCSPPAMCMPRSAQTTAQHSLQHFTVSQMLSVILLASEERTRLHWQFFQFWSSPANTNQAGPDPTHGHWVLQQRRGVGFIPFGQKHAHKWNMGGHF